MSDQPEQSQGPRKASRAEQRRRARQLALQAFYQWQMADASIGQIEAEFLTDNDMSSVDSAYFRELLHGVPARKGELDKLIEPFLDRPLPDVDPIELGILRLSAYELKERVDVPYKVVINEGVELAKRFGGTDGHKFVNGILDKLAGRLRLAEVQAGRGKRG